MSLHAFNALAAMLPEPMMLVSGEGTVRCANAACCRLLQRSQEALREAPLAAYAPDADAADVQALLARCAQGRALVPGRLTLRRGDGQAVVLRVEGGLLQPAPTPEAATLLLRLQPREAALGRFLALNQKIEELSREVRERLRAERALRAVHGELEQRVADRTAALARVNEELRRSNQDLEAFAAVASHDLQEPLRKILTFADMLFEHTERFTQEDRDLIDRMQRAAARMRQLIQSLLVLSRVSARAQRWQQVDLNAVLTTVLEDLEPRIAQTQACVEVAALPTLEADSLQMHQLFQNLVGNALKFHREGVPPHVRVWAEADGVAGYHVCVADNGIGIDAAGQERIFRPFQRLHGRAQYEGTGIGLAICRRIAERHEGTLTVTSTPDEGSTFHLRLPRRRTEAVEAE